MSEHPPRPDGERLPHPRALAFLGDAIYELKLRELAVQQGLAQSRDLHAYTTARAKAAAQVALLHAIMPHLTDAEKEIIRQGRNVGVSAGRRTDQAAHRQATGLEALIGALYLSDRARLDALWLLAQPLVETLPEADAASGANAEPCDLPSEAGLPDPGA